MTGHKTWQRYTGQLLVTENTVNLYIKIRKRLKGKLVSSSRLCIVKYVKKKIKRETQFKYYNALAIAQLLNGSDTWIRKGKGISRIKAVSYTHLCRQSI